MEITYKKELVYKSAPNNYEIDYHVFSDGVETVVKIKTIKRWHEMNPRFRILIDGGLYDPVFTRLKDAKAVVSSLIDLKHKLGGDKLPER